MKNNEKNAQIHNNSRLTCNMEIIKNIIIETRAIFPKVHIHMPQNGRTEII